MMEENNNNEQKHWLLKDLPEEPVDEAAERRKKIYGISPKFMVFAIIGVIAIIVAILVRCGAFTTKIDLNQYISVTYDGINGHGTATVEFNQDKFEDDYLEKLAGDDYADQLKMVLSFHLSYDLDKTTDLSNGDVVTVKWSGKTSSFEEKYKCKLNYSDIKFKVSGLKKGEEVDLFQYLEITYNGYSPCASLSMEVASNPYGLSSYGSDYVIDKDINKNISYDDKIIVTINDSVIEKLSKENKVPKETSKEFIAKPNRLVENESEISEDLFNILDTAARDKMDYTKSRITTDGEEALKSVEYVGSYFGMMKDSYKDQISNSLFSPDMNYIVLVYKIQCIEGGGFFNDYNITCDYYWYDVFADVAINEDEKYSYEEKGCLSTYNYYKSSNTVGCENLEDVKDVLDNGNTYYPQLTNYNFSDMIEK